ncbi:membrane protein [Geomonas sp. Red276]
MRLVTLVCPVCAFSKDLDPAVLPKAGTKVTCPKCKSVFPLELPEEPAAPAGDGPPPAGPEAASPPPSPPREVSRTFTFSFTGNAKEYFGIWIVNTLLRIVTLGLYSPWAKVRKRRYFYTNTLLGGAPFDYLADPWAILKGWFIAGIFFGLYSLTSKLSPELAVFWTLAFFAVFPWVVVRSRIFSLRNSTHRNIHFGFNPDYREAYRVFLFWQLLVPFTMGILAPYVIYRQKRFLVENSRYGTTPFRFHATPDQYFKIFVPVLLMIPAVVAVFITAGVLHKGLAYMVFIIPILVVVGYLVAGVYFPTALTNLTWNSTTLGRHRFSCRLRLRDLLWIYFSNGIAVACSLGLLAPWATVRLTRYRLECLSAFGAGGFDVYRASSEEQVGAASEELGDMLGFDLGL